jgi:S1-C subfamily serine protease
MRFFGLQQESAVLIVGVDPDGPAASARLEEDDLLIGFDGRPVADVDTLHRLLAEQSVGARHALSISAARARSTLQVTPVAVA